MINGCGWLRQLPIVDWSAVHPSTQIKGRCCSFYLLKWFHSHSLLLPKDANILLTKPILRSLYFRPFYILAAKSIFRFKIPEIVNIRDFSYISDFDPVIERQIDIM